MTQRILIVSESDDAHADVIEQELLDRRVNTDRLNIDTVANQNGSWNISQNICSWSESSYSTVWYRARTPAPHIPYELNQAYTDLETSGFVHALMARHSLARWVNPLPSLQFARVKIEQLIRAKSIGLTVPESVVTNDGEIIRTFYNQHAGQIVAKPLQAQVIFAGKESFVFGTRQVQAFEINELASGVPVLLQEAIITDTEVRAVVFGSQVHAFKITKLQEKEDIKQVSDSDLQHELYKLTSLVEERLLTLVKGYNLEFAACDFLLKPTGELVFLELNPNGQWLWLQYATGYDLTSPFISFLCE